MQVVCPSCSAEYNIDANKIPAKGAFVTCKGCSHKIRLEPPTESKAIPLASVHTARPAAMAAVPLASATTPVAAKPVSIPLPSSAPSPIDTASPSRPASIPLPATSGDADPMMLDASDDDIMSLDDGDDVMPLGDDFAIVDGPTSQVESPEVGGPAAIALGASDDGATQISAPAIALPPPDNDATQVSASVIALGDTDADATQVSGQATASAPTDVAATQVSMPAIPLGGADDDATQVGGSPISLGFSDDDAIALSGAGPAPEFDLADSDATQVAASSIALGPSDSALAASPPSVIGLGPTDASPDALDHAFGNDFGGGSEATQVTGTPIALGLEDTPMGSASASGGETGLDVQSGAGMGDDFQLPTDLDAVPDLDADFSVPDLLPADDQFGVGELDVPDDLPGSVDISDSPSGGGVDVDNLFDLPAPTQDAGAAATDSPPEFLQDLPAAVPIDGGSDSFGEAVSASSAPPQDVVPSLLDDLPAPSPGGEQSVAFDDLPTATVAPEIGFGSDDADPFADLGGGTSDLPPLDIESAFSSGSAGDADPFSSAGFSQTPPGLELDEDDLAAQMANTDDSAGLASLPKISEGVPAPESAPAEQVGASKVPKKKRSGLLLGVVVVLALLVGLVQFGESLFGFDVLAEVTALVDPDSVISETPAEPTPAIDKKAENKQPPPEPKAPTFELTAETVDEADALELRAGLAAIAKQDAQAPLRAWGLFRLASTFGDGNALGSLGELIVSNPEGKDVPPMMAAASVGWMWLSGKKGPAKKAVKKVLRRHRNDARVLYVAGLTQPKAKAAKTFAKAKALDPKLKEVALHAALATFRGQNDGRGIAALSDFVRGAPSPSLGLIAIAALENAKAFAALTSLAKVIAAWSLDSKHPSWGALQTHRVRAHLILGDIVAARQVATEHAKAADAGFDALLENVRISADHSSKEKAVEALKLTEGHKLSPEQQERLLVERIRIAALHKDPKMAKAALKAAPKPNKKYNHWRKLAEGRSKALAGDAGGAKAAYNAAMKGHPKFGEPRLALLMLDPGAPGQLMARLTQLSRLFELPEADYQLALTMAERGNLGGAVELVESVLWRAPGVVSPVHMVLKWVEWAAQTDKKEAAMAAAEGLRAAMPNDARPILTLIEVADAANDKSKVADLYLALVELRPENLRYKAAAAARLMDAERHGEARQFLDEVQANKAANKDPEVLYQLGRAWSQREPIKARAYLISARTIKPSAEIYLLLGQIDEKREKFDTARESYQQALSLDPSLLGARLSLSKMLAARGEFEEAEKNITKYLVRYPNSVEARLLLATFLKEQEQFKDAVKQYQRAIVAGSTDKAQAAIYMELARLQIERLGQVAPAVGNLKRAVAADPSMAEAYYLLGYAYKDLRKRREARAALTKFLSLAPEDDDVRSSVEQDLADL